MSRKGNCWDNAPMGVLLCNSEERTGLSSALQNQRTGSSKPVRIHRSLLQPCPSTLSTGLPVSAEFRSGRITQTKRPLFVGKSRPLDNNLNHHLTSNHHLSSIDLPTLRWPPPELATLARPPPPLVGEESYGTPASCPKRPTTQSTGKPIGRTSMVPV